MNLDPVPDKYLHELERLARELVEIMQKAKLKDDPLHDMLHQLEVKAAEARRERFDATNQEYLGY